MKGREQGKNKMQCMLRIVFVIAILGKAVPTAHAEAAQGLKENAANALLRPGEAGCLSTDTLSKDTIVERGELAQLRRTPQGKFARSSKYALRLGSGMRLPGNGG